MEINARSANLKSIHTNYAAKSMTSMISPEKATRVLKG
jgi:hypothetical protein